MRKPRLQLLAPALSLLAAGCGAVSSATTPISGALVVSAAKSSIDTTNIDQFSARFASGEAASVKWAIASGENDASLGQGSISAAGVYTPPALLSHDRIQVRSARPRNPASPPAMPSPLPLALPRCSRQRPPAFPPGERFRFPGCWRRSTGARSTGLSATTAGGESDPGDSYGSLSGASCSHSPRTYTTCTVTYTAPRALPAGSPSVFVVGAAGGNRRSAAALHVLLNGAGFTSSGLENQAAQAGYVEMGTSGGNANDYDSRKVDGHEYVNDCCGGTLGALVSDHSSNLYILSNNHVLAESDQARPGDTVVQPALVDLNCNPQAGRTVGSLRTVVPLESKQTNVDAALAAATPAVDSSGAILQLGPAVNGSLTPGAPAAGTGEILTADLLGQLRVVKSGRTTGLTCSTVNTVNLSVQVDYYYDCAETKPYYTKTFTNQIGMPGGSFADSGDSGALVLDAANAQPVGLFFASGADDSGHGFSVANPIQDVLNELGEAGHTDGLEIAGGGQHPITCPKYDEHTPPVSSPVNALQRTAAKLAVEQAGTLLARPDILGLAAGAEPRQPGRGGGDRVRGPEQAGNGCSPGGSWRAHAGDSHRHGGHGRGNAAGDAGRGGGDSLAVRYAQVGGRGATGVCCQGHGRSGVFWGGCDPEL